MVKISERLLKKSTSYFEEALDYNRWLKCKATELNTQCRRTDKETEEKRKNFKEKKLGDKCGEDDNEQSRLAKEMNNAQQSLVESLLKDSTFNLRSLVDYSIEITTAFMDVERRLFIKQMAQEQSKNKGGKPQFAKDNELRRFQNDFEKAWQKYNQERDKAEKENDQAKDKKADPDEG